MQRTISIALATAALLAGIPRPAAAQPAADTQQNLPAVPDAPAAIDAQQNLPVVPEAPAAPDIQQNPPAVPEAQPAADIQQSPPVVPDAPAAPSIQQISPVIPDAQPAAAVQQSVPEAPARPKRLPLFGVMVDVGVPDGLIGSLTIRPQKWVRVSAGGGSNGISSGWRTGITLLPFGAGPSASFEYGGYQDGDANAMAKTFGLGSSSVLQRVGYQYMNAHLGLDFGTRRFVFFLHGGVTMLRGQIHNLDTLIPAPPAGDASATGTTEVTVRRDPNAKAVGPSLKLGLIVYVW
ncbi:MAG TPA: hypothetical protein VJ860_06370 [Polyangia bacterium]|nr:hypothetical protein [Polyangia bacterium]